MNINLNNLFNFFGQPEVLADPATFNDPLALKTSWEPLKRGGSNFQTHTAVQAGANRVEFKPTLLMKILPGFFLFFALISCFMMARENITRNGRFVFEKPQIWMALIALAFLAAAYFTYRACSKAIIFDQSYGYFWKGKRDQMGQSFNPSQHKESVRLTEIHALQIISEWVRGGGRNKRPYKSYELNLILNSGERVNVTDHANRRELQNDAKLLAQFLKVPLWDRTQVQQGIMN